jgi:hypothetical protein
MIETARQVFNNRKYDRFRASFSLEVLGLAEEEAAREEREEKSELDRLKKQMI